MAVKIFAIILLVVAGIIVGMTSFCLAQETTVHGEKTEVLSDYVPPSPPAPANFGTFMGIILRIGISLIIIIVFIYLTAYVLKTLSVSFSPSRGLNFGNLFVVDQLSLGPGKVIYLIYAGRDILVVSSSDKQISLLSRIDDPETVKDILEKREKKWQNLRPFKEYLEGARKKEYLKGYLRDYFKGLKNIFGKKDV